MDIQITLNRKDQAIALAVLGAYRDGNQGEPDARSDEVHALATGFDETVNSLNGPAIDQLIAAINTSIRQEDPTVIDAYEFREDIATLAAACAYWLDLPYHVGGVSAFSTNDVIVMSNTMKNLLHATISRMALL